MVLSNIGELELNHFIKRAYLEGGVSGIHWSVLEESGRSDVSVFYGVSGV